VGSSREVAADPGSEQDSLVQAELEGHALGGVADYKAFQGLSDVAHALWGTGFVAVRIQPEAVLKRSSGSRVEIG
jgi:hypothetical protein